MLSTLETQGFAQGLFPFTDNEIETMRTYAAQAATLPKNERKRIFSHFPKLRFMFEKALTKSGLEHVVLSEYCFYIEKTNEKNWPLLMHQDANLPSFLNITDAQKEAILQQSVMLRITLDNTDENTGALKVIVGSHRDKALKSPEVFIATRPGEVILFKPLLMHGSNKMTRPHLRRVFQTLCLPKTFSV